MFYDEEEEFELPPGAEPASLDEAIASGDMDAIEKWLEKPDGTDEAPKGEDVTRDVVEEKPATEEQPTEEKPAGELPPAEEKPPEPAPEPEPPAEPDGILSKDGERVIPYSALEEAREEARLNAEKLEALQSKLAQLDGIDPETVSALKRHNDILQSQLKDNNLDPKDLPENMKLTDELRSELKEFGLVGDAMIALHERIEASQARAPAAPAPQPEPTADPVMTAIEADSNLSRWMKSELAWDEVKRVDGYLRTLPGNEGKSFAERVPDLVKMTAERLGETVATPKPAPKIDASPPPEPEVKPPSSISEIAGQTPAVEMTPREQIADAETEVEAAARMQKFLDRGMSMDDLL